MSASALQPHASIRVPTASATSGGPLDVATSGGQPVAHWWSSGCNDIWWTTGCASRLCMCAYAQHTWEIALLIHAPHGNWRANTLATAGFLPFSRK